MRLIHGRIYEGKYLFFPYPTEEDLIRCHRCGDGKGTSCIADPMKGDGRLVWFCLNEECLQRDAEISKQNARRERMCQMHQEQKSAAEKKAEGM